MAYSLTAKQLNQWFTKTISNPPKEEWQIRKETESMSPTLSVNHQSNKVDDSVDRVDRVSMVGYEALKSYLKDYIHFDIEEYYDIVALWCLYTYVWDTEGFYYYPLLRIDSPVRGCGKSRVLDVIQTVINEPIKASSMSTSTLFRSVNQRKATVLLDEIDQWLSGNKDKGELIGLINDGFSLGGKVLRTDPNTLQVQEFNVSGPKALTGIVSNLPTTIQSRSIHIRMSRATTRLKRFRATTKPSNEVKELITYLTNHKDNITTYISSMNDDILDTFTPTHLEDRYRDKYEPLALLANYIGLDKERIHSIINSIENITIEDTEWKIDFLSDIKQYCNNNNNTEVNKIVNHLNQNPRWRGFFNGRGINSTNLSSLLSKEFNVKSLRKSVGGGGKSPSYYPFEELKREFDRYLSPKPCLPCLPCQDINNKKEIPTEYEPQTLSTKLFDLTRTSSSLPDYQDGMTLEDITTLIQLNRGDGKKRYITYPNNYYYDGIPF